MAERIVLKFIPFVLAFIGIVLISYFLVQVKLINSPLIAGITAAANEDISTVLNTNMKEIKIDVHDERMDIKDFPVIMWGDKWAELSIPSHKVEAESVFLGDSEEILNQMVIGYFFNSVYPGQAGKTVLSSHVSGAFHCLEDMKKGEEIILDTIYGRYVYEVNDIIIFEPDDDKVVLQDDSKEDTLLCYTCYPRDAAYRKQRIGVKCKLVSGTPWSEE